MSRTEDVCVVSDGFRLSASLELPDAPGPHPVLVQAPGWLSLRQAAHYTAYREAFVAAGYAVLSFDYRGLGASEGPRDRIDPAWYVDDIRSVVSWASGDPRLDGARVSVFGTGGVGAGAALLAAAVDERIRTITVMSAVADGSRWLRGMRSTAAWRSLLERQEQNRRDVARGGPDEQVDPFEQIVIPAPQRATVGFKRDLAGKLPETLGRSTIDALCAFVPMSMTHRIAPRAVQLISCEDDPVVPPMHAELLYGRCDGPKRLTWLKGVNSYTAHSLRRNEIVDAVLDWLALHVPPGGPGAESV